MATDIRRMTKAELDALNEQGRLWRQLRHPKRFRRCKWTFARKKEMSDNALYRDVRGLLCRRDYCHEDAERFGLCAKHLKQIKDKKRRLRVRMAKR